MPVRRFVAVPRKPPPVALPRVERSVREIGVGRVCEGGGVHRKLPCLVKRDSEIRQSAGRRSVAVVAQLVQSAGERLHDIASLECAAALTVILAERVDRGVVRARKGTERRGEARGIVGRP